MNDIKFYDFSFNLLHIEPAAISADFTVKFCGEGSFEIHFPKNSTISDCIKSNLDIENGKGICMVFGKRNGIVTGYRQSNDFTIYGKSCDFLFRKKAVLPVENLQLFNVYDICSHFISNAFSDVVISSADTSFEDVFDVPFEITKPKTLYDVINDVLADQKTGYTFTFDTDLKKWVFALHPQQQIENKFICDEVTVRDLTLSYDIKDYFTRSLLLNENGEYEFSGDGEGLSAWDDINESNSDILYEITLKFNTLDFEKDYFLGDKFKIFAGNKIFTVEVSEVSVSHEGSIIIQNPKLKIIKEVNQ